MPGATLPNTGIVLPTLGGDSGTWDEELNAALGNYDVHDHSPGNGVKIPTAGINIDADLTLAGFGLTNVKSVAFAQVALLTAGSVTLFVNTADHELYWRTNGGTNVKLTSGSSINTSLIGGIGGDYSTVGAHLNYDDANKRYTFQTQTNTWARLATGDVRIYEFNTSESVYVSLKAPAALAAPFEITLPLALPGSQLFMQMDATGVITLSNTTASNMTAADFRYSGGQSIPIPGSLSVDISGSHTRNFGGSSFSWTGWLLGASTNKIVFPVVGLKVGDTVTNWALYIDKHTNASATITAQLYRHRDTLGSEAAVGTAGTSAANAPGKITLSPNSGAFTDNVGTGYQYYLVITPSGSVTPAADVTYHADVTVTRP